MRTPTAGELLTIWEWGSPRGQFERGLVLLIAACPEESPSDLLRLSISRRDARLLTLREIVFGRQLECQVTCPSCSERLELSFQTTDLQAFVTSGDTEETDLRLDYAGWRISYRLPDSQDLLDAVESGDPGEARRTLLRRVVEAVSAPGGGDADSLPADGLPPEVEAELVAEMRRHDAAAALAFALTCPACVHSWAAPFDVASFLWAEIDAWAYRTLREVHLLASAYGWREADVLALSPWRRQSYLQMTGHA